VTRLIWVILFAVLVGAILLFSLKTMQTGNKLNQRLAEVEQAREALSGMFPDSRFRIQFSAPKPGVRNLVVTIQPGNADSGAVARMVESAETVVRRKVDLTGYDSLIVAVFDSVHRTVPAR
jgi:hypothetical protein